MEKVGLLYDDGEGVSLTEKATDPAAWEEAWKLLEVQGLTTTSGAAS